MWQSPTLDEQLFSEQGSRRFSGLAYTTNEIDKMIEYLEDFSSECIPPIVDLLQTTLKTLTSINVNKNVPAALYKFGVAIQKADSDAEQLEKPKDIQFLQSAIKYCLKSIDLKIENAKNPANMQSWADIKGSLQLSTPKLNL